MDKCCQNCTKCFKDCDLYKHFDQQEIIPFDETEDLGNCKFSYRLNVGGATDDKKDNS